MMIGRAHERGSSLSATKYQENAVPVDMNRARLVGGESGYYYEAGYITLLRKVMAFLNYVTCLPVNNTKRTCWIMFDFPTHDEKDRLL